MTAATAFEKTILGGLRRMRGKAPVAIESTDTVNDIHSQLNETRVAFKRLSAQEMYPYGLAIHLPPQSREQDSNRCIEKAGPF